MSVRSVNVHMVWVTPNADAVIGYCARVSNPANQENKNIAGLLAYCARNGHWSVFDMANMCLEFETTRDIGRQVLRHWSFRFQEFSGRYASYDALPEPQMREARMQDPSNRQNSLPCEDPVVAEIWEGMQQDVYDKAVAEYQAALRLGIAKEQARVVLPEGLTPTRMYLNGTIRTWVTYLQQRLHESRHAEHRALAQDALAIRRREVPTVAEAFFPEVAK